VGVVVHGLSVFGAVVGLPLHAAQGIVDGTVEGIVDGVEDGVRSFD